MLKLNAKIEIGMRFSLPEVWHEKLMAFSTTFPYDFSIEDIYKEGKRTYYICSSEKIVRGKKVKFAITKDVAKYIFAQEVPDLNNGLSFKEYCPMLGTKVLITNERHPSEVIPGILNLEIGLIEINGESFKYLYFKIDFIIGNDFTDLSCYSESVKKYTWKFIDNNDESYMTDYERTFKDTVVHKTYVKKSAEKLAQYLEKNSAFEHARMLRERAEAHDNSKLTCSDELNALSRIINDKTTLKDANKQLSPIKKDAIALHWKHNSHHPEHFQSIIDMSKLDIMEMCCDWHARSVQYGTNFLEYVNKQNEVRFHFPSWMFEEILHFCNVLNSQI